MGALALVVALVMALCLPAYAAPVTEDLFYLSKRTHMAIRVDYDTASPEVSFIAPDGTAYDSLAVATGNMTKEDDGSSLFFRIPNASAGQWKVVYDKGTNKELNFTWGPYGESVNIGKLDFQQNGSSMKVQFLVNYLDNSNFNYTLSAVVLDEKGDVIGEKALHTGSATANKEASCSVSLSGLNTHDAYHLMLRVIMDSNGVEVSDTHISDNAFSFTNSSTPNAMAGFAVQIGVTDSYLRVDWGSTAVRGAQGYLLSVYEDDGAEPSYFMELESNETVHEVTMAHTAAKYRIDLRYKNRDGIYSAPVSKTVDLSMKDRVSIPDWDVTNALQIPVSYDFTGFSSSVKTFVAVNDTVEEIMLSGKDFVSINLVENQNKFSVTWWADEDVSFKINATIHSDRLAPVLQLYEVTTGIIKTAQDSYILVGSTLAGCTVTVGSEVAQVGSDGVFMLTLPLNVGTNEFAVVASSASGNTAKQTIVIERIALVVDTNQSGGWASFLQWLPLILAVLFSGLLCGHILLSKKIAGKCEGPKFGAVKTIVSNSFILVALGALVGVVWSLIVYIPANKAIESDEFYYAAQASIPEAYQMLMKVDTWKSVLITTSVVAGVALVLAIVFRLLPPTLFVPKAPKAPKEPKPPKPKKVKEPKPVQETPAVTAEPQKPNCRFCSFCGAENDPQNLFCNSCGRPLE